MPMIMAFKIAEDEVHSLISRKDLKPQAIAALNLAIAILSILSLMGAHHVMATSLTGQTSTSCFCPAADVRSYSTVSRANFIFTERSECLFSDPSIAFMTTP
jgi:hypothetical protein